MKKIIFGENKNIIHKNLKRYRINKGLTQSQLAAKLQTFGINIDQQMISKMEHNNRIVTDYELLSICRILGVTAEEISCEMEEES